VRVSKPIRDPILLPPGRWQILTGPGGRVAIYASSNTFTATGGTYSVAGGGGYEAGDAGTLYVCQPGSPVTLTAGFTGTPTSGVAPLTVHLTDTATPAGAADQWYWTLGDGGSSTAQHPVYTYTQVGVYTVTQRVTDTATSQWDALTRTNYITVTDVPVAGLSATNDSPTTRGQATNLPYAVTMRQVSGCQIPVDPSGLHRYNKHNLYAKGSNP
jgi:PKD repeat protein